MKNNVIQRLIDRLNDNEIFVQVGAAGALRFVCP